MAIEFVLEDGTGKSDATSYGSVAGFRQFWLNRGVDYGAHEVSDVTIQINLNKATEYIDRLYPWRGIKFSTDQALAFPRTHCYDDEGTDFSNSVPSPVQKATFYAAGYLTEGNELLAPMASNIRSKTMGPVSVDYGFGGEQPVRLPDVERVVGRLVKQVGVLR